MAKDDYDVILYRLLIYLYACMKRKIIFEEQTFSASVKKHVDSEEYFADIIRMAQEEGLIEGVTIKKAWGGDVIIASSLNHARITASGIRYLNNNCQMKAIGELLKESADIISKLAALII